MTVACDVGSWNGKRKLGENRHPNKLWMLVNNEVSVLAY